MAIFLVSFGFTDSLGSVHRMEVPVPRGTLTLAQLELFAQNLAEQVDPISAAQITDIRFETSVPLPAPLKDAPGALSYNSRGGLYSFSATGTDYSFGVRVPAIQPLLIAGKNVSVTDAAVLAFTGAMTAGLSGGGATPQPSDKYENDLIGLLAGKLSKRK